MFTFSLNKRNLLIILTSTLLLLLPWIVFGQNVETQEGTGVPEKLADPLEKFLWGFVNVVFGWFVWVGGMLMDEAITTFVVGFGHQFETTGLGFAVDNLWIMVRDFFNLFFIFGLVYIGFKMILNSGDTNARRMLVHIILAALLVNFSLFFTKFIVDFSNVAATQIAGAFSTVPGEYKISEQFANVLGITGVFNTGGPAGLNAIAQGGGMAYIFGTMILYLVLGFVLAAGGLLLMIRFIVLNIYMILSPVMFLGWVFPGLDEFSKKYWKGFLSRAFFAPAYLMMVYFAYFVTKEFTDLTQQEPFANLFIKENAASSFATTIPFFIFICGFLVAAILVAQKMGTEGANFSVNMGKRFAGRATKAITYPVRAPARAFVNKTGENTEKRLNSLQTNTGLSGKIANWNWVDKTVRGSAEARKNAQFGTGTTNKLEREYSGTTQARAIQTKNEKDNQELFKTAYKNTGLDNTAAEAKDLTEAFDKLGKSVRDMSKDEKTKLGYDKLKDEKVAFHLSDSDIEAFEKDGKLNAQQIQGIKDARSTAYRNVATTGSIFNAEIYKNASGVDQRTNLLNKSTKEVGKMPTDIFINDKMAPHIKPAMLEEKLRNGGMTNDEVENIKKNIEEYVNKPSTSDSKRKMWNKWSSDNIIGIGFNLNIKQENKKSENTVTPGDAPDVVNVNPLT